MYKVMIVEDEKLIREGIKATIDWNKLGFLIAGEASDGDEGLEIALNVKPDIILADIRMPGLNGVQMASSILEKLPRTEIIIISGYDDYEYMHQAILLGFCDYLLKPVEETSLIKSLDKAVCNLKLKSIAVNEEIKQRELIDDENQIEKIKKYIDDNLFTDDISLENLASKYYINQFSLSRKFKEYVGETFQNYVIKKRIEEAKNLLRTTSMRIIDVAGYVGYDDNKYFCRIFKKRVGVTPSEFKWKYKHRKN